MPARPKAKSYAELKKVWYKKLRDSGFTDIEEEDGKLKRYSSDFLKLPTPDSRKYSLLSDNLKQEMIKNNFEYTVKYYDMAEQFLSSHKFRRVYERLIWKMHSEGISEQVISNELIGKFPELIRRRVHDIVASLRNIMLGGL